MATTKRLDPSRAASRAASASLTPTRPASVSTTRNTPSRPHSRSPSSLIPDSSIDRPEERPAELPPQGEAPSGSVRQLPYRGANGKFAREPTRTTWNPDDPPGDLHPESSTDPPRGRPKAKAKTEPKAKAKSKARRARSDDGPRPRIIRHCEGPIDPGHHPGTFETAANTRKDSCTTCSYYTCTSRISKCSRYSHSPRIRR